MKKINYKITQFSIKYSSNSLNGNIKLHKIDSRKVVYSGEYISLLE
jgi:hypothetical protein